MATGKFFQAVEVPQQQSHDDGLLFPAVFSPNATTVDFSTFKQAIRDNKPWLDSLLLKTGAILLRGFPVQSPSDFNDVIEAFGYPEMPYLGGQVARTQIVGRVYTANESPLDKEVQFHHEMAYAPIYPTKLFFFCEEEPEEGGETPIVLSHIIYEKMKERHPDFVAQLEEHGLTYTKTANDDGDDASSITGTSWKTVYKTDDKKIAMERAAKLGTKLEWVGNSVKFILSSMPAVKFDEETRKKTWFNSLAVSYSGPESENRNTMVELGNGDPLDDDVMKDMFKILDEECVAIPWKKGDVLLVNNMTVLHSRRPLIKPPRRILASLCK